MPSIYDITYANRVVDLLPPDKRYIRMVQYLRAMVKELQKLHTDIFTEYRLGSTASAWLVGSTYTMGNRVNYAGRVYESIKDSNTGNLPTDTAYWRLFLNSSIGVEERLMYNHQTLVLEYACNRRFGTVFRQPPLQSDIYIGTNVPSVPVFVVGGVEDNSSVTYSVTSSEYIINSYNFTAFNNFTVYVPLAVYNAVSADNAAREKIFRNFIDQYNTAGIRYNVATY